MQNFFPNDKMQYRNPSIQNRKKGWILIGTGFLGILGVLYYRNRIKRVILYERPIDYDLQEAEKVFDAFSKASDDAQAKSLLEQFKSISEIPTDSLKNAQSTFYQSSTLFEKNEVTDADARMHRIGVIKLFLDVIPEMIPQFDGKTGTMSKPYQTLSLYQTSYDRHMGNPYEDRRASTDKNKPYSDEIVAYWSKVKQQSWRLKKLPILDRSFHDWVLKRDHIWLNDPPLWAYIKDARSAYTFNLNKQFEDDNFLVYQTNEVKVLLMLRWVIDALLRLRQLLVYILFHYTDSEVLLRGAPTRTCTGLDRMPPETPVVAEDIVKQQCKLLSKQKCVQMFLEVRSFWAKTLGKGSKWYAENKLDDLIAEWDNFILRTDLSSSFRQEIEALKVFDAIAFPIYEKS